MLHKQREGKKKERKTKSRPQHTAVIEKREKKIRLWSGTSYHLTSHAVPLFPSTEIQLDIL